MNSLGERLEERSQGCRGHDIVFSFLRPDDLDLMTRLFQGQLVLRTRCLECESFTERREDFQDISVPVLDDTPSSPDSLCEGEFFNNSANKSVPAAKQKQHDTNRQIPLQWDGSFVPGKGLNQSSCLTVSSQRLPLAEDEVRQRANNSSISKEN